MSPFSILRRLTVNHFRGFGSLPPHFLLLLLRLLLQEIGEPKRTIMAEPLDLTSRAAAAVFGPWTRQFQVVGVVSEDACTLPLILQECHVVDVISIPTVAGP